MTEHEHRFRVISEGDRTVWLECACGLGERRRYTPEGVLFEVRWKLPDGVDWIDPMTLLTVQLPGVTCSLCGGLPSHMEGCRGCNGLGILRAHGERIPLRK